MDIPGGSINAFSAITITNGIDAGYIAYNDDATISSDVDENVAEHAKILLAYFNEMYKVSLFPVSISFFHMKIIYFRQKKQ